jgi:hypothetical protein
MTVPEIITPSYEGFHNINLDNSINRLEQSMLCQDNKTIIICPTRGSIPAKVVQSWIGMMRPMNQLVLGPMFAIGLEVGVAYNQMIEGLINDPNLSTWKYILTMEEDNLPPQDGLIKLLGSIDGGVDGEKYDAMGGLYWTKGEAGMPMNYGSPYEIPKNFIPQVPIPNIIQPCNGLGMGFTLFRIEMFRKVPKPWFRTTQEMTPEGPKMYTQDLWFFENAAKYGFRFATDNRCLVGHLDVSTGLVW